MSHRPKSPARAARLRHFTALAALAAGAAATVASCTQDFGALVDGANSGSGCSPGETKGSCTKSGGCSTCNDDHCTLDCNTCGETCAPIECTKPSCSAQCGNGATCEVHCPDRGTECSVGAIGGVAHVLGAAANHTINCDQHATCSLAPITGQTGETVLTCTSGSSCSARTSGTNFKANCSGGSTCIVECDVLGDSPSCAVECNDTSVCRLKCPGGKSCDLKCGGRTPVRCNGNDGWSACDEQQCPP